MLVPDDGNGAGHQSSPPGSPAVHEIAILRSDQAESRVASPHIQVVPPLQNKVQTREKGRLSVYRIKKSENHFGDNLTGNGTGVLPINVLHSATHDDPRIMGDRHDQLLQPLRPGDAVIIGKSNPMSPGLRHATITLTGGTEIRPHQMPDPKDTGKILDNIVDGNVGTVHHDHLEPFPSKTLTRQRVETATEACRSVKGHHHDGNVYLMTK